MRSVARVREGVHQDMRAVFISSSFQPACANRRMLHWTGSSAACRLPGAKSHQSASFVRLTLQYTFTSSPSVTPPAALCGARG